MPVHTGKDSKGCYAQWGSKGKKYYYQCGSNSARKGAKAKASKQGAAAHAHGYTGNEGSKDMSIFRYVTAKAKTSVRKDTMEGRDWVVAPAQMITEGVHNGSDGPILYPAEELAKIPSVWNHKPVVVYHPTVNGASVSACDPDQLSIRKVGVLMNTEWNGETKKLGTETWLDPVRVQTVDSRVAEAIDNNEMMEVSTGLYMDLDRTPGEWNGEEYIGVAHNLQPDHLALLPDVKGACSIEDGAGFLRNNEESRKLVINALSHDGVRSLLNSAIRETKENAWIEEVYDEYFIYEQEGKMYKQTYTKNDNGVSLYGLPKLVERQVTYKEISFLAANDDSPVSKGENMDKEKVVNSLIANGRTSWSEQDRDALMALDVTMLTQMQESLGQEPEAKPEGEPEVKPEAEPEVKPEGEPTGNAAPKKLSVKEYVNQAPPEVKELLETSMATLTAEKSRLVKAVMANEKNTFTEEHLNTLHIDMLRAIANMAAPSKEEVNEESFPLYFGNNSDPTVGNEQMPEPLLLPTMNFGEQERATA